MRCRNYYQSFSDMLPYASACQQRFRFTVLKDFDGRFRSNCISTLNRPSSPLSVKFYGRSKCSQLSGMHADYL